MPELRRTACKRSSSPNNNGGNQEPQEDNPLLKPNSQLVKGQRISFTEYTINKVDNISTVYCIYCKDTDKYAVGETRNFKRRCQKHVSEFKTGVHSNQELQDDFTKYGSKSFEFIIVESGMSVENNETRKGVQNKLIEFLNSKNASYTSGFSETIEPRFTGKYPSRPGVFYIHCLENDCYYFEHATGTFGINGRICTIIQKLNKGTFEVNTLQEDWYDYGEDSFEFVPYVYGDSYVLEIERIKVVNRLIADTIAADIVCVYNTTYFTLDQSSTIPVNSPLPSDLIGPLPQKIDYEPSPRFILIPDKNKFPNAKPIDLLSRKPVYAEGAVYFSIIEAGTCINVDQGTIGDRIEANKPNYRFATLEEAQAEAERRGWSISIDKAIFKLDIPKSTKGTDRPIVVNGKWYPTLAAAGLAYNVTGNAVKKWPKNRHNNAFFPPDDYTPPQDDSTIDRS